MTRRMKNRHKWHIFDTRGRSLPALNVQTKKTIKPAARITALAEKWKKNEGRRECLKWVLWKVGVRTQQTSPFHAKWPSNAILHIASILIPYSDHLAFSLCLKRLKKIGALQNCNAYIYYQIYMFDIILKLPWFDTFIR